MAPPRQQVASRRYTVIGRPDSARGGHDYLIKHAPTSRPTSLLRFDGIDHRCVDEHRTPGSGFQFHDQRSRHDQQTCCLLPGDGAARHEDQQQRRSPWKPTSPRPLSSADEQVQARRQQSQGSRSPGTGEAPPSDREAFSPAGSPENGDISGPNPAPGQPSNPSTRELTLRSSPLPLRPGSPRKAGASLERTRCLPGEHPAQQVSSASALRSASRSRPQTRFPLSGTGAARTRAIGRSLSAPSVSPSRLTPTENSIRESTPMPTQPP